MLSSQEETPCSQDTGSDGRKFLIVKRPGLTFSSPVVENQFLCLFILDRILDAAVKSITQECKYCFYF